MNVLTYSLRCSGSSDLIEGNYIDCGIKENLRFLDNQRLRKTLYDLLKRKAHGKIIFIIATAICHVAKLYGRNFLALHFTIGDFGLTNLYQIMHKLSVTIILGIVASLVIIGNPDALLFTILIITFGLRLAFTNTAKILTRVIDWNILARNLELRIPNKV